MMLTKLIGVSYRRLAKPILFLFDPEYAHDSITRTGSILGSNSITRAVTGMFLSYKSPNLEQEIHGIKFANPVGLSAGFDKDANLTQILDKVGFGFMQVGSVTLNPYEGNPKPRLYRLKKSKGLVVYYGLKNIGASAIIDRLSNMKQRLPLSISIAKTNADYTCEVEAGVEDYYQCLKKFTDANIGDFYTINISCPNTFGGEPFTTSDRLERLLDKLDTVNCSKPIFVKMPINLSWDQFRSLLDVILSHNVRGVVIGNLNKSRDPSVITDDIPEGLNGGISGKPTWDLSNRLISQTYKYCGGDLTIIGVGGVFSAQDAYTKIKLGASLVQLITGMIFEGPQLIGEINSGLVKLLNKDGYQNISQAIGSAV